MSIDVTESKEISLIIMIVSLVITILTNILAVFPSMSNNILMNIEVFKKNEGNNAFLCINDLF